MLCAVKYASVEQARRLPGLRLVLTRDVPGPWGEAAKYFFAAKRLDYTPVEQVGGGENAALRDWSGQTSAPVAIWNDEPPVWTMTDILELAELLSPEPALIPADARERAWMYGLCREISGRNGLGWSLRLMMFHSSLRGAPDERTGMARRYGYGEAAAAAAPERAGQILRLLSDQLREQRGRGRAFLVGEQLSAADLMWAAFSNMCAPLPHALCPMSDFMRSMYTCADPKVVGEIDPALLEHRDRIFRDVIGLPLDF
jgi:glutathione S-transferase